MRPPNCCLGDTDLGGDILPGQATFLSAGIEGGIKCLRIETDHRAILSPEGRLREEEIGYS